MNDKQIKTQATKAERRRVFENMNLPAKNIYADCSDGTWVRYAWNYIGDFGWTKWEKA